MRSTSEILVFRYWIVDLRCGCETARARLSGSPFPARRASYLAKRQPMAVHLIKLIRHESVKTERFMITSRDSMFAAFQAQNAF